MTQSGSERILIPARRGQALRVTAGTLVRVINTHGTQDLLAVNGERMTPTEVHLSVG